MYKLNKTRCTLRINVKAEYIKIQVLFYRAQKANVTKCKKNIQGRQAKQTASAENTSTKTNQDKRPQDETSFPRLLAAWPSFSVLGRLLLSRWPLAGYWPPVRQPKKE